MPIASGGAHSIGSLSPMEVYESLNRFLNACTDHPPAGTALLLNSSIGSVKLVLRLTRMFGLPKWNMHSAPQQWAWRVKNTKTDAAFNALQLSNALTLTFIWRFKFIDPHTKIILEGQDAIPVLDERLHNSQLYFRASQKCTISAWFTLPFSSFAEASDYFSPFTELLPFKPSPKHWRVWKRSKNNNWTPRHTEKNVS